MSTPRTIPGFPAVVEVADGWIATNAARTTTIRASTWDELERKACAARVRVTLSKAAAEVGGP